MKTFHSIIWRLSGTFEDFDLQEHPVSLYVFLIWHNSIKYVVVPLHILAGGRYIFIDDGVRYFSFNCTQMDHKR